MELNTCEFIFLKMHKIGYLKLKQREMYVNVIFLHMEMRA